MSLVQVVPFEKHKQIKNELLERIKNTPSDSIINEYDNIHNTDWAVNVGGPREYLEFVGHDLIAAIKPTMLNVYGLEEFYTDSFWFQQYETNGTHDWHRHRGCFYSVVYYVELSEDGPVTEIEMPVTKELISPKVKEGDILIFPSICLHRSAPNKSTEKKTVIAFNLV